MHSIIRHGQFKGQMKAQRSQPLPHAVAYSGHYAGQAHWRRQSFVRGAPDDSGRIDVCRLIVATLGLALYIALPVAAVTFALNLLFG